MYAWRTTSPLASKTCDGGEAGAGDRLLRLLELGKYEDVVVVVYRWYGGVQLGNARWKCILGVAKAALAEGGFGKTGGAEGQIGNGKEKEKTGNVKKRKRK